MATVEFIGGPDDGKKARRDEAAYFVSEVCPRGYTCDLSITTGRLHGYRVRKIAKGKYRAEYLRDFDSVVEFEYFVDSGLIERRP